MANYNVRKVTNHLLEMMEEGIISPELLVTACLKYMSEDDVADMARINEFLLEDDEENDDDDDDDEDDENEDDENEDA